MEKTFQTNSKENGTGQLLFQWQNKPSGYLAIVGANRVVKITDRNGKLVFSFPLSGYFNLFDKGALSIWTGIL
jgi:hypothetical protein